MNDTAYTEIEHAIEKRHAELAALSRSEVAMEFEFTFQIRPDGQADKEDLIERILAKVRAELERNS